MGIERWAELEILPEGHALVGDTVIATPAGLVAVGGPENGGEATATWTSRDGRTWTWGAVLGPEMSTSATGVNGMATMGDQVLVFRREHIPNEPASPAAYWVGRIED